MLDAPHPIHKEATAFTANPRRISGRGKLQPTFPPLKAGGEGFSFLNPSISLVGMPIPTQEVIFQGGNRSQTSEGTLRPDSTNGPRWKFHPGGHDGDSIKRGRHRKKKRDRVTTPPRPPRPPEITNGAEGEHPEEAGRHILRLAHQLQVRGNRETCIPIAEGTFVAITVPKVLIVPSIRDYALIQIAERGETAQDHTQLYSVDTIAVGASLKGITTKIAQYTSFLDSSGNLQKVDEGNPTMSQQVIHDRPLSDQEVDLFQLAIAGETFSFQKGPRFFISILEELAAGDYEDRMLAIGGLKRNKDETSQRLTKSFHGLAQELYKKNGTRTFSHGRSVYRMRQNMTTIDGYSTYEVSINSWSRDYNRLYRLRHGLIEESNRDDSGPDKKFRPASLEVSEGLIEALSDISNRF